MTLMWNRAGGGLRSQALASKGKAFEESLGLDWTSPFFPRTDTGGEDKLKQVAFNTCQRESQDHRDLEPQP